jgi:3-deoxy-manno-octulosonate cytidylyltransferase (CMP-KDO synthetase)
MKILGVIPARFASTRFPGKPLVDIAGKTMIQRVYEQAKLATSLDEVVVATDDERILQHVLDFGGLAIMTSQDHQSGTDRCAEIAQKQPEYEVYINIQGDEPFIDPRQIELVCSCFKDPNISLATLIKKINTIAELNNPNTPKVVVNMLSEAIYFSRAPIPYYRGKEKANWLENSTYFKHIGIYGYRKTALEFITQLPVSFLEKTEALEQLRWIENGLKIKVAETDIETQAVDTVEDLNAILQNYNPG